MNSRQCPNLVLALGNDLLGDDAVALHAARELKEEFTDQTEVVESLEAGLRLLDLMTGYRRVLLLDSICSGNCPPGTIQEFSSADFAEIKAGCRHNAGLPEVLHLADQLGLDFPTEIRILALEIERPLDFTEELSPEVVQALPDYLEKSRRIVKCWEKAPGN